MVSALLLFWGGCGTARRLALPKVVVRDSEQREQLLALVKERQALFHSVRMLLRATVVEGEQRHSVRFVVAGSRPDLLRFEVFPVTGAYVLQRAVVNGDRLLAFDASTEEVFRGDASPRNIRRAIGVALSVDELLQILVGVPPIGRGVADADIEFRRDSNPELMHMLVRGRERHYIIGARDGVLRKGQIIDPLSGSLAFQFEITDLMVSSEKIIPAASIFTVGNQDLVMQLSVQTVQIDPVIAEELFSIAESSAN